MPSSVCAFAVSPAPATSFIWPPLYRTSRQWRCVYSARQQKEPVRRLRKGLARFVVVLADEESDVQLGISRKRPPIAKPTTPRHFSTASTYTGSRPGQWCAWSCPIAVIHRCRISDIHRRDGPDASRVDRAVRGDVVDLAARNADVL